MDKVETQQAMSSDGRQRDLAQRLRTERLAKGYSLAELARRVQATKGYLSRLEAGKAKPSIAMIHRIARVLAIDANPLTVLGGYVPADLKEILYRNPVEAPAVLRETFSQYSAKAPPVEQKARTPASEVTISASARPARRWKHLYQVVHGDCFDWMEQRGANSIHAVVTDPPYGLKEYSADEKRKLRRGRGGVWRIPPAFDGCTRSPLPRFTILTADDKAALRDLFVRWAAQVLRILVPGGHVFIATNPLVSHIVYTALTEAGFEKRGEIIRLVQTLRGGDRPKGAHEEFDSVTVMPRSGWEPWGLFRKPCEARVQDNLRMWKTGGLRRVSKELPFCDVIRSAPTRPIERQAAPHPSLKPQGFMRQIVRAALPLGEGIVCDPFMGAGSTIAAACAVGYPSIGIESDSEFYRMAVEGIPRLAALTINGNGNGVSLRRNSEAAGSRQIPLGLWRA